VGVAHPAFRLVTRGDLDGLTCAVVITSCENVDGIELVHPQEIADRRFDVRPRDIIANLPYHPECAKWFDNHQLTDARCTPAPGFVGRYGRAPSAARLAYEYYSDRHPELRRYADLLSDTDKLDSANLSVGDIVEPKGFLLLGFTLDPRTGLGDYKEYFQHLLERLKSTDDPRRVLRSVEVEDRVKRIQEQDEQFRRLLIAHSRSTGNVVVTDFRPLDQAAVGNRFLIYTLFPETNVSVRIQWGPRRKRVAVNVGHSIINRGSQTNIGVLLSLYGGGGHRGAGSCTIEAEGADVTIAEIVAALRRNG
jgi:hypothetical protein